MAVSQPEMMRITASATTVIVSDRSSNTARLCPGASTCWLRYTKYNAAAKTKKSPLTLARNDSPPQRPAIKSQRRDEVSSKRKSAAVPQVARKRLYHEGTAAG